MDKPLRNGSDLQLHNLEFYVSPVTGRFATNQGMRKREENIREKCGNGS